jgi:hypothetical protein
MSEEERKEEKQTFAIESEKVKKSTKLFISGIKW